MVGISLIVTVWSPIISFAQLVNPLPEVAASGLVIELEHWLTIQGRTNPPQARINHVKPSPDGVRLFCNDLRGALWLIPNKRSPRPSRFLYFHDHFPRFKESPGLGTGFCSFAFHPEFATVGAPGYGKFYTGHTEDFLEMESPPADFVAPLHPKVTLHGVIVEWTMANHADEALSITEPNFTNRELLRVQFPLLVHGFQELAFDPTATPGDDNYGCLFVCVGDGGSGATIAESTGRIDSILGTIVRILPVLSLDQSADDYLLSENGAYWVPRSNPFAEAADPTPEDGIGVVEEIFAYGFRNPHRISWDSGGTGKMFCGHIGESNIEEVEVIESGGNYGWPTREGRYLLDPDDQDLLQPLPSPDTVPPGSPPAPSSYTYPAAQFDHDEGRAIVGGYVYRGTRIPELQGMYLCGGIAQGRLFIVPEADLRLEPPSPGGEAPGTLQSLGIHFRGIDYSSLREVLGTERVDLRFGIDHDGELYLLSKQNGAIYRVKAPGEDPIVRDARIAFDSQKITLTFPTKAGNSYRLWMSQDLWDWKVTDQFVTGDGNPAQMIDANPVDKKRFYVIEIIRP